MEHDAADDTPETRGTSRRRMLQGAAVGAAGVWAMPVVTGMATAASAGSHAPPEPIDCGKPTVCSGPVFCGTNPDGSNCQCFFLTEGGQFCQNAVDTSCGGTICTTSADCPDGWGCLPSCCGDNLCRPPCGSLEAPFDAAAEVPAGSMNA